MRQGRKARFAHRQRVRRTVARIMKANRDKPGFVGVALNLRVSLSDGTECYRATGAGAVFFGHRAAQS